MVILNEDLVWTASGGDSKITGAILYDDTPRSFPAHRFNRGPEWKRSVAGPALRMNEKGRLLAFAEFE